MHLAADKYRVDSIILREAYPQAAMTLFSYEHIIETEGADAYTVLLFPPVTTNYFKWV